MNDGIEILSIWRKEDHVAVGIPHEIRKVLLEMTAEERDGIRADLVEAVKNAFKNIASPDFSVNHEGEEGYLQ